MTPDLLTQHMRGHVPDHLAEGLIRYLVHHIRPGSFLVAVLKNDLADAMQRADPQSRAWLPQIMQFLMYYAPKNSWGSPAVVEAWLARRLTLTVDQPRSFPIIDGVTE